MGVATSAIPNRADKTEFISFGFRIDMFCGLKSADVNTPLP